MSDCTEPSVLEGTGGLDGEGQEGMRKVAEHD